MISRAKQVGSNLPGWATSAAKGLGLGSLIGGPVGMALGFLKGGKNYEQFDPRGSFKGGVYTIDGVNYANPGQQNDFYDNDPNSQTYGTNRFDRAVPGSFASFRTLSDYLNRNKDDKKTTGGGKKTDGGGKKTDGGGKKTDDGGKKTTGGGSKYTGGGAQFTGGTYTGGGNGSTSGGGGSTGAGDSTGQSTGSSGGYNDGNYCFDPSTPIQMSDGSTKEIKNIQLGDATKGGEVTGVFQFKASDEIHDYKGVTVAGSHYVKEDGRFIMVKDSPLAVKIDKIPVVYSLDTSGRRIFIKNIEFADYNGDGVAKNFLTNAGVDLSGFDKEVLRQVEQRLI